MGILLTGLYASRNHRKRHCRYRVWRIFAARRAPDHLHRPQGAGRSHLVRQCRIAVALGLSSGRHAGHVEESAPLAARSARAADHPMVICTIRGALVDALHAPYQPRGGDADRDCTARPAGTDLRMLRAACCSAPTPPASCATAAVSTSIRARILRGNGNGAWTCDASSVSNCAMSARTNWKQLEPDLKGRFRFGILAPQNASTLDPEALTKALFAQCVKDGAAIRRQRVTKLQRSGDRLTGITLENGDVGRVRRRRARGWRMVADARGAAWRAHPAGNPARLPRHRRSNNLALQHTVMAVEHNMMVNPMRMGLRLAGSVEFAGLKAPPNYARADALLDRGREMFPHLDTSDTQPWMGHRPCLPDSLPVIDRAPGLQNAWLAFGHGHVGMCGAPTTGREIANLVAGRAPRSILRHSPQPASGRHPDAMGHRDRCRRHLRRSGRAACGKHRPLAHRETASPFDRQCRRHRGRPLRFSGQGRDPARRCRAAAPRHHHRHQCAARIARGAGGADHHRRLRRRADSRSAEPARPASVFSPAAGPAASLPGRSAVRIVRACRRAWQRGDATRPGRIGNDTRPDRRNPRPINRHRRSR